MQITPGTTLTQAPAPARVRLVRALAVVAGPDAMLADMRALDGAPGLYRRLYWEAGAIGQILYLEAEAIGVAATGIGCFFDDRMHALLGLRDGEFQSLYHFTVGGRVDDTRLRTLDPYEHLDH